jgi:micrococcal nuclease
MKNQHQIKIAQWQVWLSFALLICFALAFSGCTKADIGDTIDITELTACIPTGQEAVSAEVIHVADGDTITVRIAGQEYRLRYIGIDTPELDSENQKLLAEDALELNRTLVDNLSVLLLLDTSETDRYDRLLRYVIAGDTFVNYELVRRGFARAREYPPDTSCNNLFLEAENLAREEGLGIWAGQ